MNVFVSFCGKYPKLVKPIHIVCQCQEGIHCAHIASVSWSNYPVECSSK